MARKRVSKKSTRTAPQIRREKEVRERLQTERPTLEQLVASGEFKAPITQGACLESMRLAAKLKRLRAAAGMRLADLAARTGMDRGAISRLENGVSSNPTLATVDRYLRGLGKRMRIEVEAGGEQ
jgi:DNA-binding XRE family transcriptional regulator